MDQREALFFRIGHDGALIRRPLTGTIHSLYGIIKELEERVHKLERDAAAAEATGKDGGG
jgi:hypothetical protein